MADENDDEDIKLYEPAALLHYDTGPTLSKHLYVLPLLSLSFHSLFVSVFLSIYHSVCVIVCLYLCISDLSVYLSFGLSD